jgi:polysaccharide deacetylase family protein (PEP-CTERM system associated)
MFNALTIDVEDYFHVTAFERHVHRDEWDSYELRVAANISRILTILDEFHIRATFFILGWVAKRAPEMVRDIFRRGHEIACHGYGHELIYGIGPERFREDVRKSKALLEDICGEQVIGYRAPSYSITKKSLWALDILIEEGFSYDSSIFPVYHDTYGIPDADRFPHDIKRSSGAIREFPLTTLPVSVLGREYRLPIAGGGYLRLFPSSFLRKWIRRINTWEKKPAVLYFHPWEVDPDQPRIRAGFKSRFRHYLNLSSTEGKLRRIFSDTKFSTMAAVLENGGMS